MRKDFYIIGVSFLGALLVLFPHVFLNRMFIETDAFIYYYPVFYFLRNVLENHQSLFWNPFIFSGFPMYLSQSAGMLDPLNWLLSYIFPFYTGYALRLWINYCLTILFSYLFARSVGLSRLASSFVGPSFLVAMSVRLLSNIVISNSLFIFPALLFFVHAIFLAYQKQETLSKKILAFIVLAGVLLGWSILNGYAQYIFYSIFLAGVFTLFLAYTLFREEKKRSAFLFLCSFFCMVCIGGLVGLPQILPALKHTALSVRAGGLAYNVTTFKSIELGDLLNFLIPDFMRIPYIYEGRKTLYIGFLMLLFVGTLFSRRILKEKTIACLSAMALFCFVTAIRYSPVFYFMHKLPVFKLFRYPFRWMFLGSFLLAVLGAYGFDYICQKGISQKLRYFYSGVAVATTLFSSGALVLFLYTEQTIKALSFVFQKLFFGLLYGHVGFVKSVDHYTGLFIPWLRAIARVFSFADPLFLVSLGIAIGGSFLMAIYAWGRISQKKFMLFSAVIVYLTFASVFIVQWSKSVSAKSVLDASQLFHLETKDVSSGFFRVYPFRIESSFPSGDPNAFSFEYPYNNAKQSTLLSVAGGIPNLNTYSGSRSVDGYDPFNTRQYLAVLGIIGSTYGAEDETRHLSAVEQKERLTKHLNILGMMAGKYIISGEKIIDPNLVFLAEKNISLDAKPLYLYQNKFALPRFYFAKHVVFISSSTPNIFNASSNFLKDTFIDCARCVSVNSIAKDDTFSVQADRGGAALFKTNTKQDRFFVFSEAFLSGWHVSVDGVDQEIYLANGIYMAVLVPTGKHDVYFYYK